MDSGELEDLLTSNESQKTTEKAALPAYVVAAATAPVWQPYMARVGNAVYIGITSNIDARKIQHASRFVIEPLRGLPKMNYAAAKGFEQTLIEGAKKAGLELLNKVNSISPNSRYYDDFKAMGQKILNECNLSNLSSLW
jgi:hypothetical protein